MSAEPISLVEPERDSDDERFQVLFRRYYGRVKGLAARRFPSCDSDDVAQETMVRVLLHAHRLDPQRDPWPYIAAIAVNVARDLGRSKVSEVTLTEETYEREVVPGADEPVLDAERRARVRSILDGLTPASRQVLALQAYDDMSVGEIAKFLGTNDNAVRQKLFRARHQFRRALAGVPSGSFGIGAVVLRIRRRVAANLVQGSGLSFTSAAALAVAVAGAVTYTVSPGSAGHAHASNAVATDVAVLRAETAGLPETPDKAVHRSGGVTGTLVAARAPRPSNAHGTVPLPQPPVGHVRVDEPGDLFRPGQTDSSSVDVPTPVGTVHVATTGRNGPGSSVICQVVQPRQTC